MEKVYEISRFRATENINFTDYFKKYGDICPPSENTTLDGFSNFMDGSNLDGMEFDFNKLERTCNPDNLTLPDEPSTLPMEVPEKLYTRTKFEDIYPINEESRKLNVIRAKESLEMKWTAAEYKFNGKRFIKASIPTNTEMDEESDIVPCSDFIFSIIIYKPCSIHHGQRNSAEKLRFAYEIEALGQNLLSDVVDIIECESDTLAIKEVADTSADLSQFLNPKERYPSQTVFIDGVFYNDTRSPDMVDLSVEVVKWAKDKNIGKFTTARMQDTLLSSLTPRLGFPYVYIHQGDCEHIFVFSDARLIQNGDSLDSRKYPKIVSFNRSSNNMCLLCSTAISKWMVFKCDRFPQERVFLCTECCNSYLYVNGKKVTEFELYPCFKK